MSPVDQAVTCLLRGRSQSRSPGLTWAESPPGGQSAKRQRTLPALASRWRHAAAVSAEIGCPQTSLPARVSGATRGGPGPRPFLTRILQPAVQRPRRVPEPGREARWGAPVPQGRPRGRGSPGKPAAPHSPARARRLRPPTGGAPRCPGPEGLPALRPRPRSEPASEGSQLPPHPSPLSLDLTFELQLFTRLVAPKWVDSSTLPKGVCLDVTLCFLPRGRGHRPFLIS